MIRAFYLSVFFLATLSAACNVYTPDLLVGDDAGDAGGDGGAADDGGPPAPCPSSLGCIDDDAGACITFDGLPCPVDAGGAK